MTGYCFYHWHGVEKSVFPRLPLSATSTAYQEQEAFDFKLERTAVANCLAS